MTSKSGTLYTGVNNNLERRIYEHKQKLVPSFTTKYNITRLVYYEATDDIGAAIERKKQIKGWLRRKKNSADRCGKSRVARLECGLVIVNIAAHAKIL